MKFSNLFLSFFLMFMVLGCDEISKKEKPEPVPSSENKGIDDMKKTHREIDSIKSLKRKKSKRFDTLKPGVATLDITEE